MRELRDPVRVQAWFPTAPAGYSELPNLYWVSHFYPQTVYNPTLTPINMLLCWTWSRQFLKTRSSEHLGPTETDQRHKKAPERSQRKKDPSDNSRLCFLGKLTAPKNPPISVTYTSAGFVLWSLLASPGHRLLFRLLTHTHTHTHRTTHTLRLSTVIQKQGTRPFFAALCVFSYWRYVLIFLRANTLTEAN